MFAGIEALPPGHLLVSDDAASGRGGIGTSRSRAAEHRDERDATAELRDRLREAVRSHLVSDVPFGAFLSGGLDSSTIVALMSQRAGPAGQDLPVGFEGRARSSASCRTRGSSPSATRRDHHEVLVAGATSSSSPRRWSGISTSRSPTWRAWRTTGRRARLARREDGPDRRGRRRALRRLRALRRRAPRAALRRLPAAAPARRDVERPLGRPLAPAIALYALCQPDESGASRPGSRS